MSLNIIQKPKLKTSSHHPAFTLVELLIVIVVIAILAAISIIAYGGIQTRATESILQSDLKNAATQLGIIKTEDGNYPSGNTTPTQVDSVKSQDTKFQYTSTDGTSYCLTATSTKSNKAKAFHIQNGASAKTGVCPGSDHTGPSTSGNGGSGGTVATGDPIQDLARPQCDSMEVYSGSNSEAILTFKDSRGGITQDYEVAKLADGNCWMLTNLKLGSSSPITLTPGDSDVSSNFILPALTTSGSASYDAPGVYGPVPGDSGSGSTNYGYLYNWPAATAGESQASMPAGSGSAPHSICPKGWRLPSGSSVPATNEFAMLNAKMNNPNATAPSTSSGTGYYQNWHYTGPFRGVFSGIWSGSSGSFGSQGFSYLWSRSASTSSASSAFGASLDATSVNPGNNTYNLRHHGFGVRCLLN